MAMIFFWNILQKFGWMWKLFKSRVSVYNFQVWVLLSDYFMKASEVTVLTASLVLITHSCLFVHYILLIQWTILYQGNQETCCGRICAASCTRHESIFYTGHGKG